MLAPSHEGDSGIMRGHIDDFLEGYTGGDSKNGNQPEASETTGCRPAEMKAH